MSKVIAGFSMSLDGFVADPDDGVEQIFKWYSAGGTDAEVMAGDGTFEMSREGAEFIEEAGKGAGVLVTARRTFDLAHAWGGPRLMARLSGHRDPGQQVPLTGVGIEPPDLTVFGQQQPHRPGPGCHRDKIGGRRRQRHVRHRCVQTLRTCLDPRFPAPGQQGPVIIGTPATHPSHASSSSGGLPSCAARSQAAQHRSNSSPRPVSSRTCSSPSEPARCRHIRLVPATAT